MAAFLITVLLALPAGAVHAQPAPSTATGFIVRLHEAPGLDSLQRRRAVLRLAAEHGLAPHETADAGGAWTRLRFQAPIDGAVAREAARRLRADPRVRGVVPDVREQRQAVTPSDARFAEQWWLQAVGSGSTGVAGFTTAWSRSTGAPVSGPAPIVAVLDSGITSHPELNARVLPGHDFVSDLTYAHDADGRDNDPSDPGDAITAADRTANPAAFGGCPDAPTSSWHGTVIAGQLAAVTNNTEGVAAGSWNALVLPVRVAGRCGASVGDIVDGLRWAAGLPVTGAPANAHPARLIVLSYGGTDPCDVNSTTPEIADTARLYQDTLAAVRAAGAFVIVAAGNARAEVGRPGSCSGAFSVASLNREGYKATYSNFGAAVALSAPGGDFDTGGTCDAQLADSGIVSTGNLGAVGVGAPGYVAASGTSFAGPTVAAVAALMLAVNPGLSAAQLDDGLRRSARPHVQVPLLGQCAQTGNYTGRCTCTTATCGAGIVDAVQALAFAEAPGSYVAPVLTAVSLSDARIKACAVLLGRPVPPDPPDPPASTASSPSGGGGGAMTGGWLVALAFAAAVLAALRRR